MSSRAQLDLVRILPFSHFQQWMLGPLGTNFRTVPSDCRFSRSVLTPLRGDGFLLGHTCDIIDISLGEFEKQAKPWPSRLPIPIGDDGSYFVPLFRVYVLPIQDSVAVLNTSSFHTSFDHNKARRCAQMCYAKHAQARSDGAALTLIAYPQKILATSRVKLLSSLISTLMQRRDGESALGHGLRLEAGSFLQEALRSLSAEIKSFRFQVRQSESRSGFQLTFSVILRRGSRLSDFNKLLSEQNRKHRDLRTSSGGQLVFAGSMPFPNRWFSRGTETSDRNLVTLDFGSISSHSQLEWLFAIPINSGARRPKRPFQILQGLGFECTSYADQLRTFRLLSTSNDAEPMTQEDRPRENFSDRSDEDSLKSLVITEGERIGGFGSFVVWPDRWLNSLPIADTEGLNLLVRPKIDLRDDRSVKFVLQTDGARTLTASGYVSPDMSHFCYAFVEYFIDRAEAAHRQY